MKRAMTYALAAGLALGAGSLAHAQTSPGNPGSPASPGTQPGMSSSPGQSQAQKVPESQVKAALEQHGFTDVKDVKQSGDRITAKATKDGREQLVEINTTTGMMRSGG